MRRCLGIASRQYGVIARRQALEAGFTARQVDRLAASAGWNAVLPGTYALESTSPSLQRNVMGAVLWAGPTAAASYETACALRRFAGALTHPLEVSCRRNLNTANVVVHRVEPWMHGEVEVANGIPVTSVERTLCDMASRDLAPRMEELLDEALRRSLTTVDRLDSYIRARGGNGKRGPAALRLLLPRYRNAGGYSESVLETRLRRLLERSVLPPAVQQYVVRKGGRFVARVDFAWPDSKVAVEAVGRAFHEGKWERDVARLNALAKCGWIVVQVTWEDIHVHPHETLMSIAQALGVPL
jgi:very-short-patch-repair endonuclease